MNNDANIRLYQSGQLNLVPIYTGPRCQLPGHVNKMFTYNKQQKKLLSKLKNIFFVSIVGIFVLFSSQSLAQNSTQDKVVLQLKWTHQFNFAGYYAAVEKGYYRDAGLDVIIKEGKPGKNFIEEVISRRADFGVEMPELLIARNKGNPVVVLASIFQHSPQIILARKDSGIKSPHDLIGKKVMWRFDSAAELRAMLINESVSLKDIDFFELSWTVDDLVNKNIDAIHAYVTGQPYDLEKEGVESTILYPINYGIDFYGDCLFTSEVEISQHPDRVKAFRSASIRGWEYAMNNPEEIMNLILTKYNKSITKDYLRYEYEHIKELMLPNLVEIGHMNPGRWKHIGDTFVKLGMLNSDYSLDGFLYDPNPLPDHAKIQRMLWGLFILAAIISLVSFTLFIYNRKLNREVAERTKHLSDEITERKQAQEALLASEKRFKDLADNSTDCIWEIDENENYTYANPRTNELLGYTQEEILGKSAFKANGSIESKKSRDEFSYYKNLRIPFSALTKITQRKDGRTVVLESSGVPIFDNEHNFRGYRGIDRDITERIRLEERIRQSHKMEAIGTLAGGIAHDFNNILTAIYGYSDLVMESLPAGSPAIKDMQIVLNASDRARELVKQILTFSRNSQETRELIQPDLIVNEALKLMRASLPITIELRQTIERSCGPILANPTQIHQIVINLCTNAFHSIENERGVITITLKQIELNEQSAIADTNAKIGKHVELMVSDTGCGMTNEVLDRLFEPYFTTKDVGKGTGMGLAVVHGIIQSCNGFIKVNSEIGKGSTFKIYFPVLKEESDYQIYVEQQAPITKGKERILIVDDEETIVNFFKKILEQQGYNVVTKCSSIEALELFRKYPNNFELVISDQTMAGLSGSELATEILRIRPNIPIILCTGYSSMISEEKAEEIGVKKFFFKPISRKDLVVAVREILDNC